MSIPESVLINRLHPAARLPTRAKAGDAGWDIYSVEDVIIEPWQRCAISTGVAIAMPGNLVGLVHARSGRALREGFALVNAPGVVDAGFRGELKVIAINLDPVTPIEVRVGDRIAQLIFQELAHMTFVEVADLPGSDRGTGGFGSSGQ
jgi:dUTP pyrophosphatase